MRGFIPVLVAGNGEKRTLDLVARYADACNVFGAPADVRRKLGVLDRYCERAGRDPAEITKTVAEFDARDLGPDDPTRIAAIGRIPAESFPG